MPSCLSRNRTALIIAACSLVTAWTYNAWNLRIMARHGIPLRKGQTIITRDDSRYLHPAENFYINHNFRDDFPGRGSYFLRPPGYGMFYLACLYAAGEGYALILLKIMQTILFALSVICLYFIALNTVKNKFAAWFIEMVYGMTPFCCGFLFYTLTEGVTPALLIFYAFFLIKALQSPVPHRKHAYYLISSLLFSYIFLTRPVLGIAGLALPACVITDFRNIVPFTVIARKLLLFGMISIFPMGWWQIRNYLIAGQYVGLHPVYYPENNYVFRPAHQAVWNFEKGWGTPGAEFHHHIMPLWEAAMQGDTSRQAIEHIINSLPDHVVNHFGRMRLEEAYLKYRNSMSFQKKRREKHLPMPVKIPEEEMRVIADFNQLTHAYKEAFPLEYYLLAPLKVCKRMALHSNLSLYMFQKHFRGRWWMESARWLFFLLHLSLFLLLPLNLLRKQSPADVLFVWAPLIYLAYLAFFQRGIEERYTLPVLPLMLIASVHALKLAIGMLQGKSVSASSPKRDRGDLQESQQSS